MYRSKIYLASGYTVYFMSQLYELLKTTYAFGFRYFRNSCYDYEIHLL